ncbi:MAG TPA: hypothetical protein VL172_03420, partial [Kofleriaceae bacterium]|nr:hypothetical protein [Kofleriaceae bacterium]
AKEAGSSIWILDGGTPRQLTAGPADITPSFSPDGKQIAFASGRVADFGATLGKHEHTDLFVIDAAGGAPRLLYDEPRADQSGPRWSRDGRWLFATSVVRSHDGKQQLLVSVVYVDLQERPPVLRALYYPGEEDQRSGPALSGAVLDAEALHGNPTYAQAACESLKERFQKQTQERICEAQRKQDPDFDCDQLQPGSGWSEVCSRAGP